MDVVSLLITKMVIYLQVYHCESENVTPKFVQCLYKMDSNDFPWSQYVGNCSISTKFLVVTPTTAKHEINLWSRENHLRGPPLIIKQQMSDRFANFVFQYNIVMYRKNLVSLYRYLPTYIPLIIKEMGVLSFQSA